MNGERPDIMTEYGEAIKMTNHWLAEYDLSIGPFGALMQPDHPIARTPLASRARDTWARAAEFCDNPGMASSIREVERMIQEQSRQ